ncbi:hypothetical protein L7F22_035026 [Adiantum nelumboides]|nr:hypothetical protein [Adiantum nelumboides]
MSRSCLSLALFISLLLLSILEQVAVTRAASGAPQGQYYQARHLLSAIDCSSACAVRCSKASRKKICVPNCRACCRICQCVPSGTAGNREECDCYARLKNSKKTGKCP